VYVVKPEPVESVLNGPSVSEVPSGFVMVIVIPVNFRSAEPKA